MDFSAFHKENYFFEIERKDKLNGSLSFPVGIIALMGGAVSVMAKAISLPPSDGQKILIVLLVLAGLCLVVSCYYLVRTYWGHPYKYMPYSGELLDYRKGLCDFYVASGKAQQVADSTSDQELLDYITAQYAAGATFNAKSNNTKSATLFKANAFIIASLVLAVSAIPSYLYHQLTSSPPTYRVELTNEERIMATETEQQPSKQPERQETPAPMLKPTPPPSRVIKEHVEKPDRK